jgi:PPOX class F420-dependent enzyme/OxyR family protein
MFTEKEIAYLKSQPLARIATVSLDAQPDVAPVGFEFDGRCLYVGRHNVTGTRKYSNVQRGSTKVALVVDDLVSGRRSRSPSSLSSRAPHTTVKTAPSLNNAVTYPT